MRTPPKHLLVDGHNVLHAWRWFGDADRSRARERLMAELRTVHDVEGADVTLVFDGHGPTRTVDAAATTPGFAVTYASSGLTADGELERLVAQDPQPARCVVVTGDGMIRGNVQAAGGACLSPADLRAWIDRCDAQARRKVHVRSATSNAAFGNKLPL